jgi:hypothetical protein
MSFTVVRIRGEQATIGLLMADFKQSELHSVIGPYSSFTDPGVPAWSSTCEWMVLNPRTDEGGPGKMLWPMCVDGCEAIPIARDPAFDYAVGSFQVAL